MPRRAPTRTPALSKRTLVAGTISGETLVISRTIKAKTMTTMGLHTTGGTKETTIAAMARIDVDLLATTTIGTTVVAMTVAATPTTMTEVVIAATTMIGIMTAAEIAATTTTGTTIAAETEAVMATDGVHLSATSSSNTARSRRRTSTRTQTIVSITRGTRSSSARRLASKPVPSPSRSTCSAAARIAMKSPPPSSKTADRRKLCFFSTWRPLRLKTSTQSLLATRTARINCV